MVLVKINLVPRNKDLLKQRAQGGWRINPNRLYNQNELIVTYRGEVLEVYKILGYEKDNIEPNRTVFSIEEIESDLKGKKIITKTANPCTIIDLDSLEFSK